MQTGFCRMKDSLGEPEPCPGDRCAFWEGGSCAFQSLDLRGRHVMDYDGCPIVVRPT